MEEETKVEAKPAREPRAEKNSRFGRRYTFEERLKAVRLHLQEGFPQKLVCAELGMTSKTLHGFVQAYRQSGEKGLSRQAGPRPGARLPAPVRDKIIELKQENRWYGVKKIALGLRRWFFLEASPETVRKTLHEAGLMEERPKTRRNLTRPRFFERASPNQMWQSDLFTFRLGGKYAYVVAFLDDYSRYVVGLNLYRSPTAEAVIETYRVAVGEYSPPKEMLTDRGRQYTNWRGKSRFEVELQKDRVAHIVSRPQHPMTLGKVERFWATMWQEFLVRAQFDSFESARERLRLWVKYYNHRRPHQGVGGLCPADRFFEIQSQMKQTIQAGIEDNLLELALRGQPKSPFYLVGRLDGQSVVLKAEKGKLKLSLDDKEVTYELEKGSDDKSGQAAQAQTRPEQPALGGRESPGGPGDLDRTGETGGSDAGPRGAVPDAPAVAGTGDGGDAAGSGAADEPGGRGGLESPAPSASPEAPNGDRPGETPGPLAAPSGDCAGASYRFQSLNYAKEGDRQGTGGSNPQSAFRSDDGDGRGRRLGGLAQDLLRMGSAGPVGDVARTRGPGAGPATSATQTGGSGAAGEGDRTAEAGGLARADGGTAGATPADGAQRA
jgi:transposase InsO family protein